MPIKNYTTKVPAVQTVGEIQGILASHGAKQTSPLDMTPDEWEKASEALATSGGHEQKWSDVTADRILADIRRMTKSIKKMKKLEAPGVTVAAGKTAYAMLRKKFPEDPELVKIVECAYLGENECFAIKNGAVR